MSGIWYETTCPTCGVPFKVLDGLWKVRADREGQGIYCPNAHLMPITMMSKQELAWEAEINKLKAENVSLTARVAELSAKVRELTAGAVSVAPVSGGEVSVAGGAK